MKNRAYTFLVLPTVVFVLGTAHVGAQSIAVTPTSLDFGSVDIGTTATLEVRVDSTGPSPLTMYTVDIRDDPTGAFVVTGPMLPLQLEVSDFVTYLVAFTPLDVGLNSANLHISSNAVPPTNEMDVPLRGTGGDATAVSGPHVLLLIGLSLAGIGLQRKIRSTAT